MVAISIERGRVFLPRGRENVRAIAAKAGNDGVVGREMDGPSLATEFMAALTGACSSVCDSIFCGGGG